MRPLLPALRDALRGQATTKTPVPYTPRYAATRYAGSLLAPSGEEAQMRAMGANGTLFGIIDAYCTAMAGIDWHLYRSLPPGAPEGTERQAVTAHAALDLWNRPTAVDNAYDQPLFVSTVTQHLELVGTGYAVVVKAGSLPVELWPVMPHRMEPVPHPDKFLAGWIYHGPGGEEVPLGNDIVIRLIRTPCPWDPYRGMGAVQAVITALQGAAAAAEWHRNFFRNSARPDGVIEVPTSLSDVEFDEFQERWKETHQGVNNAFKVAMLEHGAQWKPTAYSPHDMQFVDLRRADAEQVREAYRMSETVLGRGETLNRATAEAQMFQFGATHVVPRLVAIWKKGLLNGRLLPMYGGTGRGLEFDFDSPVPEDKEARDRNMVSQSTAYKNYVDAGVDGADPELLRHLGLPVLGWAPKPQPAPAVLEGRPAPAAVAGTVWAVPAHNGHRHSHTPAALPPARNADGEEGEPDLSGVLDDLLEQLEQLENDYQPTVGEQVDSLVEQVERAVDAADGDTGMADGPRRIAAVAVPAALLGASVARRALDRMVNTAAGRAAGEAAGEDVKVDADDLGEAVAAETAGTGDVATAVVQLAAGSLAASAAREALRLWSPGADGAEVAGRVRTFLRGLKGSERRAAFGAMLHRGTNLGRAAAFGEALKVKAGGKIFASEQNDRNACDPCKEWDGHRFESLAAAREMYDSGGYPLCLGRERCRGTYFVTWR